MSEAYVGEIRVFAGNFAPLGWALCDGALLPIADNQVLFTLIGTTYGGDGQNTFGLPDLRGRAADPSRKRPWAVAHMSSASRSARKPSASFPPR